MAPLKGRCRVAFEVGTQAQWVAAVVRPLAAEVQVANPARIPWLFRDGRKNDKLDARKLATLLWAGLLLDGTRPPPWRENSFSEGTQTGWNSWMVSGTGAAGG